MGETKTTAQWRETVADAAITWRTASGRIAEQCAENMLILAVDQLIVSEAEDVKRRKVIEAGRCKACGAAYCICE